MTRIGFTLAFVLLLAGCGADQAPVAKSPARKPRESAGNDSPGGERDDGETSSATAPAPVDPRMKTQLVRSWKDPDAQVECVRFLPNGNFVACGGRLSYPAKVRIWDPRTGEGKCESKEAGSYDTLAVSPDGATIAVAGTEFGNVVLSRDAFGQPNETELRLRGVIYLLSADTLAEVATMKGHPSVIRSLCFSADGELLASGGDEAAAFLWDTKTWQQKLSLDGLQGDVTGVAFSPSGDVLATAEMSTDAETAGAVKLWDPATGKETATLPSEAEKVGFTALAFSPDGKTLAAAGDNSFEAGTFVFWNLESKQAAVMKLEGGPLDNLWSNRALAYAPDGKSLAVAGGTAVKLIDPIARTELATMTGHVNQANEIAFSPNGEFLVSCDDFETLYVWAAGARQERKSIELAGSVEAVAYSPGGRLIAVVEKGVNVELLDVTTGKQRGFRPHAYGLDCVAFAGDKLLVTRGTREGPFGARIHELKTWSLDGDTELESFDLFTREFGAHEPQAICIAVSPDGRRVAASTGGFDKPADVVVYDIGKDKAVAQLSGHLNAVTAVAFSPDGKRIATAGADKEIRLWDAESKGGADASYDLVKSLRTDLTAFSISFSRDGNRLAAGQGNDVFVFDLQGDATPTVLGGHTDGVQAVAFSPTADLVATAGEDRTIRFFDAASGRELAVRRGHSGEIAQIAFSPDGKSLASAGSGDRTIKLWDVPKRSTR